METFFKLMTGDTTIFGIVVHNWMIGLASIVMLWALVLVRDI